LTGIGAGPILKPQGSEGKTALAGASEVWGGTGAAHARAGAGS